MIYCLLFLFLSWAFILFFNLKAISYNRDQSRSLIWSKKDLWPFIILWIFWFLSLILILLFFINNAVKNNWDAEENLDEKIDYGVDDKISHIKSNKKNAIIVDESIISQLSWDNIDYFPIADGYYKIITDDQDLIAKNIANRNYKIPKPIVNNYCSADLKFWNMFWNWVDYNGFIYDYINWNKKDNITVAIIDSWINPNNNTLLGHIAINKQEELDNIDNDWDWYIDNIYWINTELWNWNIVDTLWHWTHIAWIVLQTFPNAQILPINVSNWDTESVYEIDVIDWLRFAIDHDVDIINLSLWMTTSSEIEHELIKEAVEKWIIVVAAAWNDWVDAKLYFPWWYEEVINVWSISTDLKLSHFSNFNAKTNLPWECVYSYWLESDFVFMDWTSMSAPHLAWMLWAYKSLGKILWTWTNIQSRLNDSTRKVWDVDVIQIAKLLWIEKENTSIKESLLSLKNNITEIKNILNQIDYTNLDAKDIQSLLSYTKDLSNNSASIKKIYNNSELSSWYGINLSNSVDDFIDAINNIEQDDLYLSVENGKLKDSLWVQSCANDFDTTCVTFSKIISWWSELPSFWYNAYITMEDYQDSIEFGIFQWENENVIYNKQLGSITISWLPRKLKGEAWATVYFKIDNSWRLSATAVDTDNPDNTISTTIQQVQRETIVSTWLNYDAVVAKLKRLANDSEYLLREIDSFDSINPFDYIPWTIESELTPISSVIHSEKYDVEEIKQQSNNDLDTSETIKENIKVAKVIDWDTIKVVINWSTQNVRLIWVDAPESYETRYWYTECYWDEAHSYLESLLKNKYVWLKYDKSQWTYDKYDRILAYVFHNWENINQKIIENWYWWEYTYNKPYIYQKQFKNAQKTAEEKEVWLWSAKTCRWKRIPE